MNKLMRDQLRALAPLAEKYGVDFSIRYASHHPRVVARLPDGGRLVYGIAGTPRDKPEHVIENNVKSIGKILSERMGK